VIRRLMRDPIARIASALWALLAAAYFIPGVSPDFLARLGDWYSTTPLWPWAVAACLVEIGTVPAGRARRFWVLQGTSFAALVAAEVPWALARSSDAAAWTIAAEICFGAYYAGQLASSARTARGAISGVTLVVVTWTGLTVLAVTLPGAYNAGWPSYAAYLTFDAALALLFWRRRRGAESGWGGIYTGLAVTSALVCFTDVVELMWWIEVLPITSGMKTDLLWTLSPLAYTLVARTGRLRLERDGDVRAQSEHEDGRHEPSVDLANHRG
jgi:hypothetical protein